MPIILCAYYYTYLRDFFEFFASCEVLRDLNALKSKRSGFTCKTMPDDDGSVFFLRHSSLVMAKLVKLYSVWSDGGNSFFYSDQGGVRECGAEMTKIWMTHTTHTPVVVYKYQSHLA